MKLFVAVAYLDRREWAGETVWASLKFGFELLVRACVGDSGPVLAAHVALYFEDVDDATHETASPMLPPGFRNKRSFFADVLVNGAHQLSVWDDPRGWWGGWSAVRVRMHEVVGLDDASIHVAFDAIHKIIVERRPYDSYRNFNSVCAWWPCVCDPTCGLWRCCCAPSDAARGINCVGGVVVALAAAHGALSEREAEATLGLRERVVPGARLPKVLIDELVDAGVVRKRRRILERGSLPGPPDADGAPRVGGAARLPLLAVPLVSVRKIRV